MSEHLESDEAAYVKEIEDKVTELLKYQSEQFEVMSKYIFKEVTALHRKHCKVTNKSLALRCEKDFMIAFIHLLEVEELEKRGQRRKGFLVKLEVEEVEETEETEDHVHEPATENKGKEDEPGLYM